jgi:peptide/nickel transport system ATP-binding protein
MTGPLTVAPAQPQRAMRAPVLEVRDLRAYYQTRYFGIEREVSAVDDITLSVRPDEIYGLAGESSCGKTSLIKTIAGVIRPPLNVVETKAFT